MPLPSAILLKVWESTVDGQKAEGADMLVLWVLPAFFTSHGVVGLADLGAWPGWGIVLCGEFMAALTGLPRGPSSGGCGWGGRSWVPDQGLVEL